MPGIKPGPLGYHTSAVTNELQEVRQSVGLKLQGASNYSPSVASDQNTDPKVRCSNLFMRIPITMNPEIRLAHMHEVYKTLSRFAKLVGNRVPKCSSNFWMICAKFLVKSANSANFGLFAHSFEL